MDTNLDNVFYVFKQKGQYLSFCNCPISNLYWLDIKEVESKEVVMSVITVDGQKYEHLILYCTRGRKLRELQHILAFPSDNDLANAVENNVIEHNSFGRKNIKITENISGPSVPGLKGKTVKQKSKLPQEDKCISIPPTIVE